MSLPSSTWLTSARERIIRSAMSPFGIHRVVNGVAFRVDPRSRARFGRDHDAMCAAALRSRIRAGDTIWNVGANVGVYTLQLAHMVGASGRVVAFEPNPRTVELLRRNVQLNRFSDRVSVEPVAVSDRTGTVQLFAAGDSPMARITQPNPLDGEQAAISVQATSLDDYAASHGRPAGIVMDIEGSEIDALLGANGLLAAGPSWILAELHPDAWTWTGRCEADLLRLLRTHGWTLTPLSGQAHPLGTYGHVLLERAQDGAALSVTSA